MARFDARLRRLEAAQCPPDDLPGPGLAALLDYARRHPSPETTADDQAPATGLAALLREARQWQEAHR